MFDKLRTPQFAFAGLVVTLTFILDLLAFFYPLQIAPDMLVMVLSIFNSIGLVGAIQFVLGSSAGSKDKDGFLQSLRDKNGLTRPGQ